MCMNKTRTKLTYSYFAEFIFKRYLTPKLLLFFQRGTGIFLYTKKTTFSSKSEVLECLSWDDLPVTAGSKYISWEQCQIERAESAIASLFCVILGYCSFVNTSIG